MKIKSSKNNHHFILLGLCTFIIATLILFKSFDRKKKTDIEFSDIEQKTDLSALQITIKEKHYQKIKKKRNQALADGILETNDNDYVPAIITFNKKNYEADIRLKGDWVDHLEADKWSYRIKLKNDRTIFGMRKFSVHHPKTRGYINEWLYHKANKSEGLIGLRYDFVEGFLHVKLKNNDSIINKNVGIYAIEETFDKRTIENNKRKAGVILRISEQYFWKEVKQAWYIEKQTGFDPSPKRNPKFIGPGKEYVSTFGLGKILQDQEMSQQYIHAKNLLEAYRNKDLKASEVFDVKKLALHTALNNLFCAYHGLEAINLRYYYNPTTSMLEPIAYDGNSGGRLKKFHHYYFSNKLKDSKYRNELIKALEYVSRPEYLNKLFNTYQNDLNYFQKQLEPELGKVVTVLKQNYIQNQTILRQELTRLKKLKNEF